MSNRLGLENIIFELIWTLNSMKNWPQEGLEHLLFELTLDPKHDEELFWAHLGP